ncbi:MAG: response regulator transcription factor [Ferruginibacter sp.]
MPIKIAIVDDKPIVRSAIKDKLYASADISIVLEACNGDDFLEKLRSAAPEKFPEIILIDLEMPKMDGIETIAVGAMLYPAIKFIVLTVFDNSEKIFEAIKAGASGYLLKDDTALNLTEAIINVYRYDAVPMSPAIARKTLGLLKTGFAGETENLSQNKILSSREQDVLRCLVEGLEYRQIAERLFVSPATVRTHIAHIYQKLHVTSKAQAINLAHKNKWI